ncbi:MAG: ATP-grasp domain-containing protein [Polyangiaceae bacterium]|nr:ATP-grasp domain-containing protein [Polyangiaceae bacterium]
MPFVIFTAPYFTDVAIRFIEALSRLPDMKLGILSLEPFDKLPRRLLGGVAAYLTIKDVASSAEIERGAKALQAYVKEDRIHRLFGAVEQIQEALAEAREHLGVEGMSVETAKNFRDKGRMKSLLREAGIPCAKHKTVYSEYELWEATKELGFPLIVKPPAGAGAESTFRVNDAAQLKAELSKAAPSADRPVLVEEMVIGNEHSFETITIGGKHIWHSLTHYHPTPLEVLRNPWIQWSVVLPREIDDPKYDDIRDAAYKTLDVLGMDTGLSHMEWFRRNDGSIAISEVGARPPGAQFTTLVGLAHEIDLCYAWAKVMVYGEMDPPKRRFAAGAAYLRGQGTGNIRAITGIEQVEREVGHLIVGSKLPSIGQAKGTGYEGDGYLLVRHERTEVVQKTLQHIISTVRVECG